jgi:cell division protein FtsQ
MRHFWENAIAAAYPIRYVRVEGATLHLDEAQLVTAVNPLVRVGMLEVDLDAIDSTIRSFAWIDDVRVLRQWPDTVVLQLREHQPVARWNEDSLVSDRGKRFRPQSVAGFLNLPHLYGVEGREAEVLDVWRRVDELIAARNWHVTMVACNFRQSWTARLSDGKELIIGRQDPVGSVSQLLKLLPELGDRQTAAIRKVDLRYRNGFAVVWRFEPESAPPTGSPAGPAPRASKEVPGVPLPLMALNQ